MEPQGGVPGAGSRASTHEPRTPHAVGYVTVPVSTNRRGVGDVARLVAAVAHARTDGTGELERDVLVVATVVFKPATPQAAGSATPQPFLVAFSQVYLSVTPEWPVTLLLTREHRRVYARVFHMLTRLKLARLVAQRGMAWPSHGRGKAHMAGSRGYRDRR